MGAGVGGGLVVWECWLVPASPPPKVVEEACFSGLPGSWDVYCRLLDGDD